jgi:hypothetical protein
LRKAFAKSEELAKWRESLLTFPGMPFREEDMGTKGPQLLSDDTRWQKLRGKSLWRRNMIVKLGKNVMEMDL